MIIDDIWEVLPEGEFQEVYHFSGLDEMDEVDDIHFLDYLYEVQHIELRPRVYKGDFGERLWCVEVYDWSKNKECHIKNLVGFKSREEAVHSSIIWYYKEYIVKNS